MGNVVVVSHGNGIESWHAHNSRFLVDVDALVDGTTPLGIQGATGFADGPHDHLEIHINGRPVDPVVWLASMIAAPAVGSSTPFIPARDLLEVPMSFDMTHPLYRHTSWDRFVVLDLLRKQYRVIEPGDWETTLIKEENGRIVDRVRTVEKREPHVTDYVHRDITNAQWEASFSDFEDPALAGEADAPHEPGATGSVLTVADVRDAVRAELDVTTLGLSR